VFYHSPCMCKRQSKHLAKSEDGKGGRGLGHFGTLTFQSQRVSKFSSAMQNAWKARVHVINAFHE